MNLTLISAFVLSLRVSIILIQRLQHTDTCFEFDRVPYKGIFGGAIALNRHQYENVNGFSNQFYGWGGEDDDMYRR